MGLVAALVLFIFLALDWRHHWDEPTYLYVGSYFSLDEIRDGGFGEFYVQKIIHPLLIKVIVKLIGPGIHTLYVLMFIYLFLLIGFSIITYQILRDLLPDMPRLGTAVAASTFTPIYLYFAFKTMPEIPALFLAGVATLGLLRSMKGQAVFWLSASAISLSVMALLKVTAALMYISCIVALVLCKSKHYPPVKLITHGIISGVASVGIFYVALTGMGIEFSDYLALARQLTERKEPLISRFLHALLECGIFIFAFPFAFFFRQKAEALFFMVWFLIATIPLFLIYEHIEARFLAANLIAISGLLYCAIQGLSPQVHSLWCRNRPLTVICGCLLLTAIVFSNSAVLAIMSHEVRTDQFDRILTRLDRLYGENNYVILTPWPYTTFEYIRFVYPEREVYNVNSVNPKWEGRRDKLRTFVDHFYQGRNIRSLQELKALDKNLVYLGFEENFSVANLRNFVRALPAINVENQFEKMTFLNQISLSWMWQHPQLEFSEKVRHGHYVAYAVTPIL